MRKLSSLIFCVLLCLNATAQVTAVKASLLDPQQASTAPPNRLRDITPQSNAPFGTLAIRRSFVNTSGCTGAGIVFKILDFTSGDYYASAPNPLTEADLRLLNSATVSVQLTDGTMATVHDGTLNHTGVFIQTEPLTIARGAKVRVQFKFSVLRGGPYRFVVEPHLVPAVANSVDQNVIDAKWHGDYMVERHADGTCKVMVTRTSVDEPTCAMTYSLGYDAASCLNIHDSPTPINTNLKVQTKGLK